MGDSLIHAIVSIATAIIGIAVLAVLVSQKAKTSDVITAAGKSFAGAIQVATNPFSGSSGSLLSNTSFESPISFD